MPHMMLFKIVGSAALIGTSLILVATRRTIVSGNNGFATSALDRVTSVCAAARDFVVSAWSRHQPTPPSSSNTAFDGHQTEARARLDEDQRQFAEYMERLRHAEDTAKFKAFITDRKLEGGG